MEMDSLLMSMKYRAKSLLYILFYSLAAAPCAIFTLTMLLYGLKDKITKVVENKRLTADGGKTILLTGCSLTKGLQMAKLLGKEGHKIIVAEMATFQFCGIRSSSFIHKFYTLPTITCEELETNEALYINRMIEIMKLEKVDWFIPISHLECAVVDCKVAQSAAQAMPHVRCLTLQSPELANKLNDKLNFLRMCKQFGLSVPDSYEVTSLEDIWKLKDKGIFETTHYFLKPLSPHSQDRENFDRVPADQTSLKNFLKSYHGKLNESNSYFVSQFIRGKEFAANVICKEGNILLFQICPCSPMQIDYDVTENPNIEKWVEDFCKKTKVTGCLCFDFLEDSITNQIYCIECNPRMHSMITSYHFDRKLNDVFKAALEPEELSAPRDNEHRFPVKPSLSSTHVYWFYHELIKLITGQQSLMDMINVVTIGKDAMFDFTDPLPFFIANTIQMTGELCKAFVYGRQWSVVNPCLGQLR